MSHYTDHIRKDLATTGNLGVDPRHVEAWMVLERGTLDSMSAETFRREVVLAAECTRQAGPVESEDLARSFGV